MARRGKKARRRGEERDEQAWRVWWDRLPDKAQHTICLLLLLVLSFSFFGIIHFSDQTLIGGDSVQWRGTAEAMFEYEEATGEQALWSPNTFAGMPGYLIHYTDVIRQIDIIPGQLRKVIWPSSHFIFLLLGVYLVVVFLSRNKLAGVLGAAAFGLTTYIPIIFVAGHNVKFITLAYAPWLVLAFAYTLRHPRLLGGLLFAIACALNLKGDHPQITYYVLVMLGVWWIAEGIAAVREQRAAKFAKATGWLALGGVVSLLMVANPYLPLYEYKAFTIRGASTGGGEGGLDYGYAMGWSQGVGELVTLLIPGAYGGGGGLYWGPKPFTAGPHYLGGIVVLLSVLALWALRRRAVAWGLGTAVVLMILFSLGEHFAALNAFLFEYFPLFDAFRVPETWLAIVALATAILAGLGAAYVARREASDEEERQKSRAIYGVAGGVIGLVLILWLGQGVFFDFERPNEEQQIAQQLVRQVQQQRPDLALDDPQVQQLIRRNVQDEMGRRAELRRDMFDDDALRTLIFLLLATAILVAYRRGLVPAWATTAALALLVVIDLWNVDRRYFNEEQLVPESQEISDQAPRYPFDDYLISQVEQAGGPGHFRVLSLEAGDPMANARPSYYYESLGGYHGAKLRLYQDFIDYLFRDPQTGLPNEAMLDLLNTQYIIAQGRIPGYDVVYQDPRTRMAVLRNPDVLPRAFFVGQTEVVEDQQEAFEIMTSPSFDPAEVALLPEPIDFETTPMDSASTTRAELQDYTPRRIAWQVETDAPRLLVVSEVYYPAGWNAYVDGEQVPIYRADHLLRAVPVPAGSHEVVMRFEPRSHTLGIWVGGVTSALVYGATLLLLGLAWRRRRSSSAGEDEERAAS